VTDEKYEKYDDLATKFDIHVLTGALKLFFRELQEPLFTFALFDSFLKTMGEFAFQLYTTLSNDCVLCFSLKDRRPYIYYSVNV
jgi:hypothetical protein